MTDHIEWGDPPLGAGTEEENLRDWALPIALELRARPGVWGLVWKSHHGTRMPEYLRDMGMQTKTHLIPTGDVFARAHVYARAPKETT